MQALQGTPLALLASARRPPPRAGAPVVGSHRTAWRVLGRQVGPRALGDTAAAAAAADHPPSSPAPQERTTEGELEHGGGVEPPAQPPLPGAPVPPQVAEEIAAQDPADRAPGQEEAGSEDEADPAEFAKVIEEIRAEHEPESGSDAEGQQCGRE